MKSEKIKSFGLFNPNETSVRKCCANRITIRIFLKGSKDEYYTS